MAVKLTSASGYLQDFAGGQGVGRPAYTNYPADLDTNFGLIATTVNQVIDELNAAKVPNQQLFKDTLITDRAASQNSENGRLAPWYAQLDFAVGTSEITVSSGTIWVNGRRLDVTGATLDAISPSVTHYIAVDQGGLLSISTTADQQFFDIAEIDTDGSTLFTDSLVDQLGFDQLTPLVAANTINAIYERVDGTGNTVGLQHPPIRMIDADGGLNDAGFAHSGTQNRISWMSERDGGNGSGSAVEGAWLTERGQLALLEQARVFAERTTTQSIDGGGFEAVVFDAPSANSAGAAVRREPESYFATPWFSSSVATLQIPGHAALDGTYDFTATIHLDTNDETFVEARIVQTAGGSKVIAEARIGPAGTGPTKISLAGSGDFENGDSFQLQVDHDASGGLDLDFARLTIKLAGGPV